MTTEQFLTLLQDYAENAGLGLDDLDDATLSKLNRLAYTLAYTTEQILDSRLTEAKMTAFEDAFGGEE